MRNALEIMQPIMEILNTSMLLKIITELQTIQDQVPMGLGYTKLKHEVGSSAWYHAWQIACHCTSIWLRFQSHYGIMCVM